MLVGHFDDPPAFVRSLHHLMEFYADRARRPGQSGKPGPMMHAYHIRQPVLRQLLQELVVLAAEDQEAALNLCNELWNEPYLEFRMLAAMLLGQIPTDKPDPVLGRIQDWIKPNLEDFLINTLLKFGLVNVRRNHPQALIHLIQGMLNSDDKFQHLLGLRALLPMIEEPEFENLPVFFRMIQPLTRKSNPSIRQDLLDVLAGLAHRSPKECAFFLRQTLEMPGATDTAWLIRQSLGEFPEDIQLSLRKAVRGISAQPSI